MNRIFYLIIFIINVFMITSCEKKVTNPPTSFTVKGYVYYLEEPIDNVAISIDDKYNWTTSTNSDGFFEITGVSTGSHELNMAKSYSDSTGFTEKTISIAVYDDLLLDYLMLPKAVYLYEAIDVTEMSAVLRWSPTDDATFREYKLFRHNSSGLDETTGTLVHVSTSINDTSFVDDQLNPNENYYYRVYIMNDYGRIGGSNIINFKTDNIDIIKNGSFEIVSNNVPVDWILVDNSFGNPENYIKIDSSDAFKGNNCLKFFHAEEGGCYEMWISQTIDKSLLVNGATYRLFLSFKAGFDNNIDFDLVLRNSTFDMRLFPHVINEGSNSWNEITYDFGLPDDIGNNNVNLLLSFCLPGINTWWLDEIKVERIE